MNRDELINRVEVEDDDGCLGRLMVELMAMDII